LNFSSATKYIGPYSSLFRAWYHTRLTIKRYLTSSGEGYRDTPLLALEGMESNALLPCHPGHPGAWEGMNIMRMITDGRTRESEEMAWIRTIRLESNQRTCIRQADWWHRR